MPPTYVQLALVMCLTATNAAAVVPRQMYLDTHINSTGGTWTGGTECLAGSQYCNKLFYGHLSQYSPIFWLVSKLLCKLGI